jgi:hypothetical protein
MLAETEAKFASVGPTAEEDIGPALAPHLAKPDRDVDPGSGAGGHGSAVGERPEPSTRINKRRISSGRKPRSRREDMAATMPALLHSIKPPRLHQIEVIRLHVR